jgi:hypothetical protein
MFSQGCLRNEAEKSIWNEEGGREGVEENSTLHNMYALLNIIRMIKLS